MATPPPPPEIPPPSEASPYRESAAPLSTSVKTLRGEALKHARLAAGLTATDLAQRVNDRTRGSDITHHAIYSYERGKVLLSREVGHRIAQALHLHPGELLIGDPDFHPAPPGSGSAAEAASAAVDSAPPATFPGAGLPPADRVQLQKRAYALLPVARVLGRLLSATMLGRVNVQGHLDVFNLLLGDAAALLDSPEAARLAAFRGTEGHESLDQLLEVCRALHLKTRQTLILLLDERNPQSSSLCDACHELAKLLAGWAEEIENKAGLSNRGWLGRDGD